MGEHNVTTTFGEVEASTDVDWLYEVAGDCDFEPANPGGCPNCLAYIRAQEIEGARVTQLNPSEVKWCRGLFDAITDGGVWGVPRSGLIFEKRGSALVLVSKMPHDPGMPLDEKSLDEYQEADFEDIRKRFEAAGVKVEREV